MKNVFFIIFLAFIMQANAQYEIIHEDVNPVDTVRPDFGPNGKKFAYSSYGLHTIIPIETNAQAPVMPGASLGYKFGFTQKYRICSFLSFGYNLEFNSITYRYKQTDDKTFPDTLNHLRQSVSNSAIGAGLFLRINFDPKRGNYLGYFLDMGGYGDWHLSRTYKTKDEDALEQIVYNRVTKLNFMEKYQYGLYASIGLNKINIYARYRMSDIFKAPYKSAELPRLSVGLGLSIF